VNAGNFFAELKRRNVYRVAVAYAVVAWLLIQIATQVFPFFEIPNWVVRLIVLLLALGFPVALVLGWAFELTPEGIKRAEDVPPDKSVAHSTGRKWTAIIVVGALAATALLLLRVYSRPHAANMSDGNTAVHVAGASEGDAKSIAVLRSSI
jgi:hypothetical protein